MQHCSQRVLIGALPVSVVGLLEIEQIWLVRLVCVERLIRTWRGSQDIRRLASRPGKQRVMYVLHSSWEYWPTYVHRTRRKNASASSIKHITAFLATSSFSQSRRTRDHPAVYSTCAHRECLEHDGARTLQPCKTLRFSAHLEQIWRAQTSHIHACACAHVGMCREKGGERGEGAEQNGIRIEEEVGG